MGLFRKNRIAYNAKNEEKSRDKKKENHMLHASNLLNGEHYEMALTNYGQIIEMYGQQNSVAWNNAAYCLFKLSRIDEAIECISKAILLDPENAELWVSKGTMLAQDFTDQNQMKEAIECYSSALQINPNLESTWLSKATFEERIGLLQDAKSSYQNCIEYCSSQLAADFLKKLESSN